MISLNQYSVYLVSVFASKNSDITILIPNILNIDADHNPTLYTFVNMGLSCELVQKISNFSVDVSNQC